MGSDKGYIEVDENGNITIDDIGTDIFLGSVFPKYNLAWRNDLSCKGIHLGFLFRAA